MTKKDFIWLTRPDKICARLISGAYGCPSLYGLSEDCSAYSNCEDCWSGELDRDVIAEAKEDIESFTGMIIRRGERLTVKECEVSEGRFWAWSDRMFWLCGFKDRSKFKFYLNDKEDKKVTSKFELKPGMKVRVKRYDQRPDHWNSDGEMDKYMGKVVTIKNIAFGIVRIKEDRWIWRIEDFVPVKFTKSDLQDGMMLETADGNKYLWLHGERRGTDMCVKDLPEKFEDEAKEYPQYEVVKVGYPKYVGGISDILRSDFDVVLWDKRWTEENTKEITAEEAAKLLKEKFPEYDGVKITV